MRHLDLLPKTNRARLGRMQAILHCWGIVAIAVISNAALAQTPSASEKNIRMDHTTCAAEFPVIEFRRYTIRHGELEHFAKYFESFFPEAIQQSGAIVAGTFFERNADRFSWFRGFHSMDERAKANSSLYYGPVWKEHKSTMNGLMLDSDNVLLLRPLTAERGLQILPSVDPVKDASTPKGVVVAQIFSLKPNSMDAFIKAAEPLFAQYRAAGLHEAGVLVTLDERNNFPQLPIRTDGTFVVWLGIGKDENVERHFAALASSAARSMLASGFLTGDPEIVLLDPAARSRLRWLPDWQ